MAKKKKKTKKSTAKKKTAKKVTANKSKTKKVTKKKTAKKVAKKTKKKATKKVVKKVAKKVTKKVTKKAKPKKESFTSKISKKLKDVGKKITAKTTPKAKATPKKEVKPKKVVQKKKVAALVMGKQFDDADAGEHDVFSADDMVFFNELLQKEKEKILKKAKEILSSGNMELDRNEMSDEVDLASATIEQNLQFRLLDRDRKLLNEIEHAISKISSGDFGYCEGTGEIIPKRRLELRPWTRHSVKFKEQLEKMKKSGRGVADDEAEDFS